MKVRFEIEAFDLPLLANGPKIIPFANRGAARHKPAIGTEATSEPMARIDVTEEMIEVGLHVVGEAFEVPRDWLAAEQVREIYEPMTSSRTSRKGF